MSLPYLHEFGWKPTVLAVEAESVEGAKLDPVLEKTVPADIEVNRVAAISPKLTRRFGLGSLAVRALPYLWRGGNRLLSDRDRRSRLQKKVFDLVYFSTTQFPVTILGPVWKRRFGAPYVVDFQDPWLDDYYGRTGASPPGGQLKYAFSRFVARQFEPRVMRHVSQVISVSPAYVETLLQRYPYLRRHQFAILPFGVSTEDLERVNSFSVQQRVFHTDDGKQHWVYVGAVGKIMQSSLRLLFSALRKLRDEDLRWNQIHFHFVGTSYAPENRAEQTVTPVATECGVADMMEERTTRVSYFESLKLLQDAHALLVIGSDSKSYNPSKLATYAFARKPLLAILHQDSPGIGFLHRCKAGMVVPFDPAQPTSELIDKTVQGLQQVFAMVQEGIIPNLVEHELAKYTAREMTRRQCEVFDRALNPEFSL